MQIDKGNPDIVLQVFAHTGHIYIKAATGKIVHFFPDVAQYVLALYQLVHLGRTALAAVPPRGAKKRLFAALTHQPAGCKIESIGANGKFVLLRSGSYRFGTAL